MIKVTEKQKAMIHNLVNNDYSAGDIDAQTWTSAVCETASDKSVFGSLVKRGLAYSNVYDNDSRVCGLTDSGKEAYRELFPAPADVQADAPADVQADDVKPVPAGWEAIEADDVQADDVATYTTPETREMADELTGNAERVEKVRTAVLDVLASFPDVKERVRVNLLTSRLSELTDRDYENVHWTEIARTFIKRFGPADVQADDVATPDRPTSPTTFDSLDKSHQFEVMAQISWVTADSAEHYSFWYDRVAESWQASYRTVYDDIRADRDSVQADDVQADRPADVLSIYCDRCGDELEGKEGTLCDGCKLAIADRECSYCGAQHCTRIISDDYGKYPEYLCGDCQESADNAPTDDVQAGPVQADDAQAGPVGIGDWVQYHHGKSVIIGGYVAETMTSPLTGKERVRVCDSRREGKDPESGRWVDSSQLLGPDYWRSKAKNFS